MIDHGGLYLHIPFCGHRCGYCDFATWSGRDHLQERYLTALAAEATLQNAPGWRFETIFIGGGTPSRLSPPLFSRLIGLVREIAPDGDVLEGTMEANPESLLPEHLGALPGWQRRRVSLGVQDFSERGRRFLEREHDPAQIARAVELVREAGGIELNLDLIAGWTGQTLESLEDSLARTLDLAPEHISVYLLTVEPGTKLGTAVAEGTVAAPDPEFQADAYLFVREHLIAAGYHQYEISNFAREPRFQCRHNRLYWSGGDWLGLGVSAASHASGRRWSNHRSLDAYLAAVDAGTPPIAEEETLTAAESLRERAWLALRLSEGLRPADLGPEAAAVSAILERHRHGGLVETDGDRYWLTPGGMLLSNEIFEEILFANP